MKNYIILLLALCSIKLQAQTTEKTYPVIGKLVPEFAFKTTKYYDGKDLTSKSIKGKHTLLYFWAKNCGGCILSMPKINELNKQFKQDLMIALVGFQDKENAIQPLYEKVRKKNNLELTVAFDSTTFNRLSPGSGVPILLWIDAKGIVKAVTGPSELNAENISRFNKNEEFNFIDKSEEGVIVLEKSNVDFKKPLLINGNGGADTEFLFRSMISKANPKNPVYFSSLINPPMYQISNMPLQNLVYMAYLEKRGNFPDSMYKTPIYENNNPSIFKFERGGNMEGMYSYSLIVPNNIGLDRKAMMKIIRRDLQNYFNIRVDFENRVMPCLILKAINLGKAEKLIENSNEKADSKWDKLQGGWLFNIPIKNALESVTMSLEGQPFTFNESGISGNVSLKLNAYLKDLDQIREELQKLGLDLVPSKRMMPVMVIKDAN